MKKNIEKSKLIIDVDPGVDDIAALMLALFDPKFDVLLLTTVSGNRPLEITTRNTLHFLEKFNLDFPVAMGASKPLARERIDAAHIHGETGMGTYIPKDPEYKKCLEGSAEDNMWRVINENPHEVTLVLLGPQTNAGLLFKKYPECAKLLKRVVFMGGSPYGYKKTKPHISFNISSDPEAFDILLRSGVELVMIPSELGRRKTHLTYKQVMKLKDFNDCGMFLYEMYKEHWEPGFDDMRIATNDSCVYFYLAAPNIFKAKRCDISVNTTDAPGKTLMYFRPDGKQVLLLDVCRRRAHKLMFDGMKRLDGYKFY